MAPATQTGGDLRSWRSFLVFALVVEAVWASLAVGRLWSAGARITIDSAVYVDCARSIVAGRGFATRVPAGLGTTVWEPMTLWPPGYPLAAAAGIRLGLSPFNAALGVSLLASAIAVLVVGRFFWSAFPPATAYSVSLVAFCMPAFTGVSVALWSEPLFLLLGAGSVLLLHRSVSSGHGNLRTTLASGVAAGLAFCVRYAGIAFPVALPAFLLVRLRGAGRRAMLRSCLAWLGGWLAGAGWLLVHNALANGRPVPYSRPPSDRALLANIGDAYDALLQTTFSLPSAVMRFVGHPAVAACGAVLVAALIWRSRKPAPREAGSAAPAPGGELLLLVVVLSYAGLLVVARTQYRWGELIGTRHVVPVAWMVVYLLARAAAGRGRALGLRGARSAYGLVALCSVLVVQEMHMHAWTFAHARPDAPSGSSSRSAALAAARLVRGHGLVLSEEAGGLRVLGDVNARLVARTDSGQPATTRQAILSAFGSGTLAAVIAVDAAGYRAGTYGEDMRALVCGEPSPAGVRRRRVGAAVVIEAPDPGAPASRQAEESGPNAGQR